MPLYGQHPLLELGYIILYLHSWQTTTALAQTAYQAVCVQGCGSGYHLAARRGAAPGGSGAVGGAASGR